jgi:hypothetical protein
MAAVFLTSKVNDCRCWTLSMLRGKPVRGSSKKSASQGTRAPDLEMKSRDNHHYLCASDALAHEFIGEVDRRTDLLREIV